jgi:hypothetical protein
MFVQVGYRIDAFSEYLHDGFKVVEFSQVTYPIAFGTLIPAVNCQGNVMPVALTSVRGFTYVHNVPGDRINKAVYGHGG